MYNFQNKIALVTGGTDGIGLAAAQRLYAGGAHVVVAGRNRERGARALATLHAEPNPLGASAHFVAADMGVIADVDALFAEILAKSQRLDIAVNNAAAEFPLVPTAEIPLASVEQSIAVDLRGTWLCMKHEINIMLTQAGGVIVNVSSVNGYSSSPNAAMYSATKHGMNGLSAAAAREYMAKGIRINTVCPGAIETPRRQRRLTGFTPEQIEAHYRELAGKIPAGRVASAAEVAAGIVWLCSDESSYVVGHDLVIDGGLTA
jgi:NAD(P)-dependent dehydrogenase (short-subunit alcohol dehydrogenase family)